MLKIELGQNIKVKRENLVKTPTARRLGERAWQEEQFWLQYFIEIMGTFPRPHRFVRDVVRLPFSVWLRMKCWTT